MTLFSYDPLSNCLKFTNPIRDRTHQFCESLYHNDANVAIRRLWDAINNDVSATLDDNYSTVGSRIHIGKIRFKKSLLQNKIIKDSLQTSLAQAIQYNTGVMPSECPKVYIWQHGNMVYIRQIIINEDSGRLQQYNMLYFSIEKLTEFVDTINKYPEVNIENFKFDNQYIKLTIDMRTRILAAFKNAHPSIV